MDLKSILLHSEDSLPTLEQNLSTATAGTLSLPTVSADSSTYWKFGGSAILGLAGMVYLSYGKKQGDVQKMIIGAVMTLASIFIF